MAFEHAANGFPVPQRGMVSANRGHHWVVEDCTLRAANAVALDIGNETWNAAPAEIPGYSIVRRNRISDAGVCGLAGYGVHGTLIEYNTIENIGWHDVEPMWESAGIKLHRTHDSVLRGNVIRGLRYASGIWLDYLNVNTRTTRNVVVDVSGTLWGGIFLEASHEPNMIDHNIVWKIGKGQGRTERSGGDGVIVTHSDESTVAHNLIGRCEGAAVRFSPQEFRMVAGRGGLSRRHRVLNNVFFENEKSIEFPHADNTAEGNVYSQAFTMAEVEGKGLNWIMTPTPAVRVNLPTWRKYFGFDKTGAYADLKLEFDAAALRLAWSAGQLPDVAAERWFRDDFAGTQAPAARAPGPFARAPQTGSAIAVDPRK
jgi:hypothetical protein